MRGNGEEAGGTGQGEGGKLDHDQTHFPSTFSRSEVIAWASTLSPRKTAVWLSADIACRFARWR
jgi:hypothetical protein